MARYRVVRAYSSSSDGKTYGPWVAGDVVDLTDYEARWLDMDSPRLLSPAEREQPKPRDRQSRGGRNRGMK